MIARLQLLGTLALRGSAFMLATAAAGQPATPTTAPPADHVILISIDGFLPEYVDDRTTVDLPNLHALRDWGSYAEGVIGQYPSLTYPSHTSIVTGVAPARHGVFQNTRFEGPGTGSWYFESTSIQVPTLWHKARSAGLTTAGVSWPVSVGAEIDFLYPETHQNPPDMTWLELARRESTPGLVDAVVEDLGGFGPRDNLIPTERDRFATAVAVRLIKEKRPSLLMIHLVQTDYAQHATGPHSIESDHAFVRVDRHIGEIIDAVSEAGILERTAFVITGDHGFYRVHSSFQPNVVLRRAGLLHTDDEGKITSWQATAQRAAIRLADPSDQELAQRVEVLFDSLAKGPYQHLFTVLDRQQLDALGADPEALLYLEPVEGFSIAESFEEDRFLVATDRRGTHGFLPTNPRMHTGLVVSGAGIRKGVVLPIARQIDIAATVAQLLGFRFDESDGVAMSGVIE